jgi:uncharacterized iron-regulated membrane protein
MKEFILKIHLALGLTSGLIVFIVAITGAIYTFKSEIEGLTQEHYVIETRTNQYILPSEARHIAGKVFPGKQVHGVVYGKADEAAEIVFYEEEPLFYRGVLINPYSGEILKIRNYKKGFFRFILAGHFQLWLPLEIGRPVISIAVLIFVIMLITGLILWWPWKRPSRDSFRILFKSGWKRKLFDLHSVFGFYASVVLLILALTGLVWGFKWFSKAAYKVTGGKKELAFTYPVSDSTYAGNKLTSGKALDSLWLRVQSEYPAGYEIEVHFPDSGSHEVLFFHINPDRKTYWKTDFRYFDRYTLKEVDTETLWGRIGDATGSDKFRRMNYDIHTGSILGIPGKIFVFLASIIAASLPVTGFMMWLWNRKEKGKLLAGLDL